MTDANRPGARPVPQGPDRESDPGPRGAGAGLAAGGGEGAWADALALSALADGEARGDEVDRAVAAWGRDPAWQRAWRDWHHLGDALRSDDLARPAAGEEEFLNRLRSRLAQEPPLQRRSALWAEASPAGRGAVRIPTPGPPPSWRMPLALAAGVAAVAFGISLLQAPATVGSELTAARQPMAPTSAAPTAAVALTSAVPRTTTPITPSAGPAQSAVASSGDPSRIPSVVLRDPQLDSLLRAQRPASRPAEPSGAGRVETVGLDR